MLNYRNISRRLLINRTIRKGNRVMLNVLPYFNSEAQLGRHIAYNTKLRKANAMLLQVERHLKFVCTLRLMLNLMLVRCMYEKWE